MTIIRFSGSDLPARSVRNELDSRIAVLLSSRYERTPQCGIGLCIRNSLISGNSPSGECPADTVEVRGKIECSFKPDDKVLATLIFRDRQPEASGPETALDIHDGRFDGRVAFDTYSSSSLLTGDRCYRRPKFVLIRLIEADGFEMDRMSLKIASDFNYNENQGEYSVRSAVILRGWCQPKCAETQATPCAKTK